MLQVFLIVVFHSFLKGVISQGNYFQNTQGQALSGSVYGAVLACNTALGLIGNMTASSCNGISNSTATYQDLCR